MKLPWISRARHERERFGALHALVKLRKRYRRLEKAFEDKCQELAEMKRSDDLSKFARGLSGAMSQLSQADPAPRAAVVTVGGITWGWDGRKWNRLEREK